MSLLFYHAADLHLDSPFRTHAPDEEELSRALRMAAFNAFDTLIDACIRDEADFLLIAGDVYDGKDRSLRAQLRFRDGLARLADAGIPSFVVHGNHDSLDGWSSTLSWPEKVHIFGGDAVETILVEKEDQAIAAISGISYPRRDITDDLTPRFKATHPELFQVALLHANSGQTGHEPYAPFQLDSILRKGFDYWALGHVHAMQILNEARPTVAYPGVLQGRNVRETGPKGALRVKVDDSRIPHCDFIPFDQVRWFNESLDVQDIDTMDQLADAIQERLDAYRANAGNRPSVCRLTLHGETALYGELEAAGALDDFLERARDMAGQWSPFVWLENLKPDYRPTIDLEERRQEDDLLGELLKMSEELRQQGSLPDSISAILDELNEYLLTNKLGEAASDEDLQKLLGEAESLCAHYLESPL